MKRFRVRGAGSWKEVELAEREAKVLAHIAHPNLPVYVDHFEEAAATLGARRMTVFRRVTVPLIAPSLGAGAVQGSGAAGPMSAVVVLGLAIRRPERRAEA